MTRQVTDQERYIFVITDNGNRFIAFCDPNVTFTQADVSDTEAPELFGDCQLIENAQFACEQVIEYGEEPNRVNAWSSQATIFYEFKNNFLGNYSKPIGKPR